MSIASLLKPPTPLRVPPSTCASSPVMVDVPKSASSVMKHLVPALLHRAGRSMIHSADDRVQVLQGNELVEVLPVLRSLTVRLNSLVESEYETVAVMMSPGFTLNTLTEFSGNISYQASYLGVVSPA